MTLPSPQPHDRLANPDSAYEADAAFLKSVMASSGDCIKVLDLDGNLVYMTESGRKVMEVSDFNAIRGCPWPDFWQGPGNADALAAVAAAKAGGIGRFQGAADTMLGNARFWDVQVTPILGQNGKPERLLSVSRDITASRQIDLELRQTRERLEHALKAGRIGYWEYDVASQTLQASDICKTNFGRDADAPFTYADLQAAVHPDDRAMRDATVDHCLATGEDLDVQYRIIRPDGSEGWVWVQARRHHHGAMFRLAGLSIDITVAKREEQHRRFLSLELNHRIKNQMAVVQSIVNQSLRGAYNLEEAKQIIGNRLATLARAHDLLLLGQGERTYMHSIVQAATELLDQRRVTLDGPELAIGPKAALSIALILHELSTNAIKHGAFSVPEGQLSIAWGIGELDGAPALELTFIESGGPLVVPPTARGFGSRLLQAGLSGSVSRPTLDYPPEGLRFHLLAVLETVQSEH